MQINLKLLYLVLIILFLCNACSKNEINEVDKNNINKTTLSKDNSLLHTLKEAIFQDQSIKMTDSKSGIIEIKDISETTNKDKNYKFPKTVDAVMNDGSKKIVSVTWDYKGVKMLGIDKYIYYGNVEGYDKRVSLTLNFNSKQ